MIRTTAFLASLLAAPFAFAAATVGQPAPDFSVADASGKTRTLKEFAGKTVVLEWHNPECPFVRKHYGGDNMQQQQQRAAGQQVVWLTINSGKPGKQGHLDAAQASKYIGDVRAAPAAYLIDASSEVGMAYGAKTTPHMYVIDGQGTLRYAGAIDSTPSADIDDIPTSKQYVTQALAELAAGKPVSVSATQPYGCSVKY
jgi:peroxiredoxin